MNKYRIFRSLDKPSVFFGIKGKYMTWAMLSLGIVACLAILVGTSFSSLLGFVVFLVGLVVVYFAVLSVQSRITDRQMSKIMAAKMRVKYIKTPAHSVRSLFNMYK